MSGLRDQDWLEGASNYVIWKARISFLLDEHELKAFINSAVDELVVAAPLRAFKKNMAKAKWWILNGVKDHIVSHISSKGTAKEMWDALAKLYQGSSEQWTMFLEEKMWSTRMQKGESIDPFLEKLQDFRDQLAVVGAASQATEMVRLALNFVSEEYQVFVKSILGREKLSDWEGMWAALQQETYSSASLMATTTVG